MIREALKRTWTVWEFRSVDGRQVVRVARARQVDDFRYVHHFQRIVAQVDAFDRDDALRLALAKESSR